MSLLKSLLQESGSAGTTYAGSIAVNTTGIKTTKKKSKKDPMYANGLMRRASKGLLPYLNENDDFDEVDAEAKLKNSDKKAKNASNCKAFALEDNDGNTVKIYVKSSDADEFEKELENALTSNKSVAEIVFELNKEFDIVDAEWGEFPEDEEEEIPLSKPGNGDKTPSSDEDMSMGPDDGKLPPEGDANTEEEPETPLESEEPAEELGSDDDMKSTLNQIIDMLKTDIQAKKSEAEAKKTEAEAKKAEQKRLSIEAKSKVDAEMLDAEDYFKKKKDDEKEQRQMELLAKYRREKSMESSDEFGIDTLESISNKMSNMMFENFKTQSKKFRI